MINLFGEYMQPGAELSEVLSAPGLDSANLMHTSAGERVTRILSGGKAEQFITGGT